MASDESDSRRPASTGSAPLGRHPRPQNNKQPPPIPNFAFIKPAYSQKSATSAISAVQIRYNDITFLVEEPILMLAAGLTFSRVRMHSCSGDPRS